MTLEEELDAMEQRARGSQKARAHVVTLDRCPCCGTRLAAALVAEIKCGEQLCPHRADVVIAAVEALRGTPYVWGAA
jgi:hypothetical protein